MELVYINMNGNHFKVWGFDMFSNTATGECDVVSYWGRIGVSMSKLQKKKKTFKTYADAYDYVWAKMREKQDKGYWTMPNSQYFGAINDEKPLFQLVNLINCYKKDNDFLTSKPQMAEVV